MRKLRTILLAGLAVTSLLYVASGVAADDSRRSVRASLDGYQEVPSLSTTGTGRLRMKIDDDDQLIHYKLSYEGLESAANAAHIHLGQRATNGGVIAFLCGGGDKPVCPPGGGTVEGTIDAADIVGPAAQGIEPGAFEEVVRAIRAGAVYANVHTTLRPGGEIRGQLGRDHDNHGDHGDHDDDDN